MSIWPRWPRSAWTRAVEGVSLPSPRSQRRRLLKRAAIYRLTVPLLKQVGASFDSGYFGPEDD
jgi:type IV secretory pathway protease TraF